MATSIHLQGLARTDRLARSGDLSTWGWPAFLLVASVAGDLVFACATPFAAMAVIAAGTLSLPKALLLVGAIWLGNQAVGFGLLSYPADATTLLWGGAIAAAALVGASAASLTLRRLRGAAAILRLVAAFAAAFASYEAVLYIASLSLGGQEAFQLAIIAEMALINAVWFAGVMLAIEVWRNATDRMAMWATAAV